MEKWKKILLSITLVAGLSYLVFSVAFFQGRRQHPVCQALQISISDANQRQFVSSDEMRQFILRAGLNPEGQNISLQRCHQIEQTALQHPMVRTATCYVTPSGNVVLDISQRQPKLRVMGADNYFVDTDRKVMPVRSTTASDVPIITGHVSQRMACQELYDFVDWMENDRYWPTQIDQIHVVSPQRIELIPRVGSGVIILGPLNGYETKLKKLKTLYQKGFSKFGWKEYREIDLRFKGQVVCR